MGGAVDKVAEGDEGCREAYGWTIESRDEDFGVGVECMCDVEVVGHEVFQPVTGWIIISFGWG